MVRVYFSHLGNPLLKGIKQLDCQPGNVFQIIEEVNLSINGIISCILSDSNKILSSVRIFTNIEVEFGSLSEEPLLYETDQTFEVSDVFNTLVGEGENLLISLFEPELLRKLFEESLAPTAKEFSYKNLNQTVVNKPYRPIIEEIKSDFIKENIFSFKNGETTLGSLKIETKEDFHLAISEAGFDKTNSKLLPMEMVEAIKQIWDISSEDAKLRLFQEDSLFFILAKMINSDYPVEKTLLLSMPTGGGKTEAFMIPLLSYIFKQKEKESLINSVEKRIRSIVIYPTNALANDQAKRFVELIYLLNKTLRGFKEERKITIGILTGDTPSNSSGLPTDSLIQICPRCGNSEFSKHEIVLGEQKRITVRCKSEYSGKTCNHELSYCRLTKDDILENPPDILITNPDSINFSLHSPKYARIFYNNIDAIVFDEVHMYEGTFGCHVSHLLRRLEHVMKHKPLYIGLSATVGNAQELAALLFNENTSNVCYINNKNRDYTTNDTQKYRYHAVVRPRLISESEDEKHYERTITTAFVMGQVLGHLIADPHFRKTIVFANYRSEADDIAKFLKEREELDFQLFIKTVIKKWEQNKPLDPEESEIGLWIFNWYNYMKENAIANKELVEVGWNRGGLEKEVRIRSVHLFSANKIINEKEIDSSGNVVYERSEKPVDVMVATKTLELGIDIGDVTTVINSSAPYTVNEYVQRVGRGGRKKDSFALTIINPENALDAYFERHFEEYVKNQKFEDVPIIVTNEVIVSRHIVARILDYVTSRLYRDFNVTNVNIKVKEFVDALTFNDADGSIIGFYKNCGPEVAKKIAKKLFDKLFLNPIGDQSGLDYFLQFIKNESETLGVQESPIDSEFIYSVLEQKLIEISTHFNEGNKYWQEHEFISGFSSKDKTLTPSLRGSGETVGLYLNTDDNTPKDVIARHVAFNSMPPKDAPATSGISTFLVYDRKGETDVPTEIKIRREIRKIGQKAINFFGNKFPSFPSDTDDVADYLTVIVPKDLRVRYYPERFYCKTCKKGLLLDELRPTKHGLICKCGTQVSQLSQVYLCADKDGCGSLQEPPVAKVCINPECPDYKYFFDKYKAANFTIRNGMLKTFKFRLTRDLEWVCQTCGMKLNFHKAHKMVSDNPSKSLYINKIANEWRNNNRRDFYGLAVDLKSHPEIYFRNNKNLDSSFNCKSCRKATIRTVSVPRVRTVSFNYLHKDDRILCETINTPIGEITFTTGKSIQLASEYFRRYSAGGFKQKETKLRFRKIFDQDAYLGNYFETHMAWLQLNDSIYNFVNSGVSCGGNCFECEKLKELELGNNIAPRAKIEEYNWDADNHRPRKPDPREKYCTIALKGDCSLQTCTSCDNFDKVNFLKYILVHTLKHSILWAMPKYAGVNISSIRGEIFPNDGTSVADIVFIDSDDGGSGTILLVQKNWNYIWDFAKEITFMASDNKANLLLPHTCSRFNRDLCPFLAAEFLRSI